MVEERILRPALEEASRKYFSSMLQGTDFKETGKKIGEIVGQGFSLSIAAAMRETGEMDDLDEEEKADLAAEFFDFFIEHPPEN
ncbi:hypothetical protein ACFLQ0_01845 [Nitrospinota bacterium]